MVLLHIKLRGMMHAATWVQIIYPRTPHTPTLGVGSKGQNSTFSEHGHVVYQIKWDHKCSNRKAHILSLHTPLIPGVESKVKIYFFLKVVMLHYQIRREWSIEHHASTYSVLTHTLDPWGGVKCQNIFSESSHVAY